MRELPRGAHDADPSEFGSEVDAIACRCRFTDCCTEVLREKERWKRIHEQARQPMLRKRWGEKHR
jgi:hypothetical protein